MIKTIIFDIGNVLMNFDYMPYVRELLKDEDLVYRFTDYQTAREQLEDDCLQNA